MAGKPLIYWTMESATNSRYIEKVYISTDSDEIREVVSKYDGPNKEKIEIINRSKETADDNASTESAMLEFAHKFNFDNIILIQATSPLLETAHLDSAIKEYSKFDSIISLVEQKRFIWKRNSRNEVYPVNYNYLKRPRRQEFEGVLIENGAFYITSKKRLLETKSRISGRIGGYVMPEESYFEIDEPSDWIIIENILYSK